MVQSAISENLGEVNAWQLPRDQFLKETLGKIICGYCPGIMHPATSKLGTQFFAHNPGQSEGCPTKSSGESEEHLFLKSFIAVAARSCGWDAVVEDTSSIGIRPDVLCIAPDGRHKIAFEPQLSSTSADRVREKTLRHEQSGIDTTIWVARKSHQSWQKDVPTINLESLKDQRPIISFNFLQNGENCRVELPLEIFVCDILKRRIEVRKLQDKLKADGFIRQLMPLDMEEWVFTDKEEYQNYIIKGSQYRAIVERRTRRRNFEYAKTFCKQMWKEKPGSKVGALCVGLVYATGMVPDKYFFQYEHAGLKYGKHTFLLAANPFHDTYSHKLYRVTKSKIVDNPDWIIVDRKIYRDEDQEVQILLDNLQVLKIRRMSYDNMKRYLRGEFVMDLDLNEASVPEPDISVEAATQLEIGMK
ncbi:MAG TPA: hypothetical protein VK983_04625 [Candidatus Limnocylindrales bacterium]|nr:hypothetical protein [Candidatus Limnocylindrales bacterium]